MEKAGGLAGGPAVVDALPGPVLERVLLELHSIVYATEVNGHLFASAATQDSIHGKIQGFAEQVP